MLCVLIMLEKITANAEVTMMKLIWRTWWQKITQEQFNKLYKFVNVSYVTFIS